MFGANVNGVALLISNAMHSLLVYRKGIDLCIITWYPVTLLLLVNLTLHRNLIGYIHEKPRHRKQVLWLK